MIDLSIFAGIPELDFISESTGLIIGDLRKVLSRIPDNLFQCCITSPPYWGLRDYGIEWQIGAENESFDATWFHHGSHD